MTHLSTHARWAFFDRKDKDDCDDRIATEMNAKFTCHDLTPASRARSTPTNAYAARYSSETGLIRVEIFTKQCEINMWLGFLRAFCPDEGAIFLTIN